MITYKIFTDKGGRDVNEDSAGAAVSDAGVCFVLCDGLGGHGKGEVASYIVVESIKSDFAVCSDPDNFLPYAFENAQKRLMEEQKKQGAVMEMKTTAVVLLIYNGMYRYGHIGDSRLYVMNEKKILQRTMDHSVPQLLCMAGEIKEKQIRHHPDRNRLLRVMGIEWETGKYEISQAEQLKGNERFLLCSDGFWELIVEKDMVKTLKKSADVDEWVGTMAQTVMENGRGKDMDNFTAIGVMLS